MSGVRLCAKAGCGVTARFTMTYVHADATVVVGPLATRAEPGALDLCRHHASRMTAPRGWELLRLDIGEEQPERSRDDLLAIADAVREAARPRREPQPPADLPSGPGRGHLRIIAGNGE
ncbi:MAG: DUF3499 domain-containing protein [Brevibacterium yomogidense]|uniref:DUF3499 domain-containing protein n=1 Tax=Brevibacterium sp. Mu109 TaxID=1255669 RepID=UPI0021520C60|nr:DUF3499 domain-containing protein [Brevibacterium sp. Mu109]